VHDKAMVRVSKAKFWFDQTVLVCALCQVLNDTEACS